MTAITKDQLRDIRFLMQEHAYSTMEATASVVGPRKKVRAPTLGELENMGACLLKEKVSEGWG